MADFSDGTGEALETIGRYELQNGITSIGPAMVTLSEEMVYTACIIRYNDLETMGSR